MTYTRKFSDEIPELIEKLAALAPGEALIIEGQSSSELEHTRWLIYSWMHFTQVKPFYRIQSEPTKLRVLRRGPGALSYRREGPGLSPKVKALLEQCLREAQPGEEEMFIIRTFRAGEITPAEFAEALQELQRALGQVKGDE